MSQLRKILNTALDVLAGGSLLVMTILTCYQVFTRYILQDPSSWSEELVSYMFGWSSLFGAAIIAGERGHMNIPILVEKMGKGAQKALAVFGEVVACLFAIIILLYGGVQITSLAMGQMTSSLGVPIGVFYVVMPIAGVLIAVYSVLNIYDIVTGHMNLHVADEAAQAIEKVEKEGL